MGNRTEKVDVKEDQVCDAACSLRNNCKNCTQVLYLNVSKYLIIADGNINYWNCFGRVRACGAQIRIAVLTRTPTFLPFLMVSAPNGQHMRTNAEIWTSRNLKMGAHLDNEMYP